MFGFSWLVEDYVLMKQGSTRAAVLLIAPAITVLAVVIGYPIVRAVYLSFQSDKHLDPVTGVFVQGGFARGVEETGGTLLPGAIDFGPTVRFYGDQFAQPTRSLADIVTNVSPQSLHRFSPTSRVLVQGWANWLDFVAKVLAPLAAGGSVVVATGDSDRLTPERLDRIIDIEKVSERLP